MEIPQIVRQYIDTCNPAQFNAFLMTFAADATYRDPGTPQPLSGPGIRGYFSALFAAFPDIAFETVAVDVVSDQMAVWRWIMRGTNTGSIAGIPATQRSVTLPGCEFIEIRDGQVQRVQGYFDQLTVMRQLGLIPAPPSA